MQDGTVLITVTTSVKPRQSGVEEDVFKVTCSGVIVAKSGGILKRPKSLIVTAHHCVDSVPGQEIDEGTVTAVLYLVKDSYGRECEFNPLLTGGYGADDVATGVASCDLGVTANLARGVPQRQEQIFVSGHPMGVYPGLITTGYFSGWSDDWMSLSAPAWSGNSGGPIYNSDGDVVGLLVRGSRKYHMSTLAAPLGEIRDRVRASDGWDTFVPE
jgi:S1-C subfamily serine protease